MAYIACADRSSMDSLTISHLATVKVYRCVTGPTDIVEQPSMTRTKCDACQSPLPSEIGLHVIRQAGWAILNPRLGPVSVPNPEGQNVRSVGLCSQFFEHDPLESAKCRLLNSPIRNSGLLTQQIQKFMTRRPVDVASPYLRISPPGLGAKCLEFQTVGSSQSQNPRRQQLIVLRL